MDKKQYISVKPGFRGNFWEMKNWPYKTIGLLKEVQNHMDLYMTGQGKCDLLIRMTV